MKRSREFLALLAGGMVLWAGCSSSASRLPVYDRSQVGAVIKSQGGEIVSVRDVLIKAPSSNSGSTGMGAKIGGAAGRGAIFGGVGAAVGAAGAVIGEAVGSVAGAKVDDRVGEEIVISVEGQLVTIVQDRSDPPLAPGERVLIVTGASSGPYGTGGNTKVVRDDGSAVASAAPDGVR